MMAAWTPHVNALLGSLVVSIGAWLAWDTLTLYGSLLFFAGVFGFLIWRGTTINLVWAWSTLLLGIESLAWPVVTMVQVRSATDQPTDEQMGVIFSAMVMGLFSSVFWIVFSYGLFKRGQGGATGPSSDVATAIIPEVRERAEKKR